jgi:hypothetical protein
VRELVVHISRRRLVFRLGAVALVFALAIAGLAGVVELDRNDVVKLLVLTPLAGAIAYGGLRQLRAPRPALRLSERGLEGAFGTVAWQDVTTVEVRWSFGLYDTGRRVVVGTRPGAPVHPSDGDYAERPLVEVDVAHGSIEIAPQSLELGAKRLAREIDRSWRLARGLPAPLD